MFKKSLLATMAGQAIAAGVDYKTLGKNWPSLSISSNECGGDYQSPINLLTNWEEVSYEEDKFFKHYEDLDTGKVTWKADKYSTYIDFPTNQGDSANTAKQAVTGLPNNYFRSKYMGIDQDFKAIGFHFHSRSEHTINDVRFDFEMHTVHLLDVVQDGFFAAAQGLIFDTKNYDQNVTQEEIDVIDAFFDSLQLDKIDPDNSITEVNIKNLPYGQLMNMAAHTNRWVYTGSLTTPPCTEKIYWNVVKKVYPIKPHHLGYFQYLIGKELRKQTASKGKGKEEITFEGNYRVIQDIKKQNPRIMVSNNTGEDMQAYEDANYVLTVILIVVVVNILILVGLILAIMRGNQKSREEAQQRSALSAAKSQNDEIQFAPVDQRGSIESPITKA